MLKNICLVKSQELYDIISDAALEAQQSVKPVKNDLKREWSVTKYNKRKCNDQMNEIRGICFKQSPISHGQMTIDIEVNTMH